MSRPEHFPPDNWVDGYAWLISRDGTKKLVRIPGEHMKEFVRLAAGQPDVELVPPQLVTKKATGT